jgi:hypothetical protein
MKAPSELENPGKLVGGGDPTPRSAVPIVGGLEVFKAYPLNEELIESSISSGELKPVSRKPTVGVGTWADMVKLEKTCIGWLKVAVTGPPLSITVTVAVPWMS